MLQNLCNQQLLLLSGQFNLPKLFFLQLWDNDNIFRNQYLKIKSVRIIQRNWKLYRKNKKLYQHVYSFALYPEDNQPSSKMYADWLLSRKNLDNMMNETTSHSAYLPKHTNTNCIIL
jgi:hypothetical protein